MEESLFGLCWDEEVAIWKNRGAHPVAHLNSRNKHFQKQYCLENYINVKKMKAYVEHIAYLKLGSEACFCKIRQ